MKKQKVTLETIANKLGVTKVSVFKALKNQPGVSDALRERIVRAAQELGYMNKSENEKLTITKLGFLVTKRFFLDTDNFYTLIYYFLERECAQNNINISLYILNSEEEEMGVLPFNFQQEQQSLNGLFIAGEISKNYIKETILKTKIATVAIDFHDTDLPIDSIVTDNYLSGYTITQYLINMGHRDIGFVGDPHYTASVMDRFCGYYKALIQHHLEYHKEWHLINNDINSTYEMDYTIPQSLPTAFVCHCDMAAYKLMIKLQSNGISVPNQVSIISFDNTDLSQNISPKLTTMDINKKDMSSKALNCMLHRLKNPDLDPQKVIVNNQLVIRDSVAEYPYG
ncbi:LacI family transcriptional regulator [Paenibacillus castaneae]|uniref:LacI family DNA-binding transcriptional regulator n=1 Tax=Paenibacillus castaneae TaxID=474957 RepID=UPI000C9A6948|nr:LacI family DNA-binding transcriptional regulator [Paenibacillus castaneae]NIK77287.1 LacI family transcriptional regulator [Paenibacillus castaneae]